MGKPEIIIKTVGGTYAEVYIDGKKLEGVKGYSLTHKAGELPQLQLDMKATCVTVETSIIPELPAPYKSHYVSISRLLDSKIAAKCDLNKLLCEDGLEIL